MASSFRICSGSILEWGWAGIQLCGLPPQWLPDPPPTFLHPALSPWCPTPRPVSCIILALGSQEGVAKGRPWQKTGGRRRVRPSLGHCGVAMSPYSGHSSCQAGLSTRLTSCVPLTAPSPCSFRPEVLMAPTA